jgi:hypothetical protein
MSQKKAVLNPPAPVYDAFHARDKWIARVDNIQPLEKPDPYAGCRNGSDRLARMLELADGTLEGANHLFTRP